jgi:NifU-like protein involved in Fe-S cluster formation
MTDDSKSVLQGPYNERVRALFAAPAHAVAVPDETGRRHEVSVRASAAGPQLQLVALVQDNHLLALRFRVFGCPHLIAAAEACCEQFEGGPVEKLGDFSVSELMTTLGVPVEKTGRILLLEDAVRALLAQITDTANNED